MNSGYGYGVMGICGNGGWLYIYTEVVAIASACAQKDLCIHEAHNDVNVLLDDLVCVLHVLIIRHVWIIRYVGNSALVVWRQAAIFWFACSTCLGVGRFVSGTSVLLLRTHHGTMAVMHYVDVEVGIGGRCSWSYLYR